MTANVVFATGVTSERACVADSVFVLYFENSGVYCCDWMTVRRDSALPKPQAKIAVVHSNVFTALIADQVIATIMIVIRGQWSQRIPVDTALDSAIPVTLTRCCFRVASRIRTSFA